MPLANVPILSKEDVLTVAILFLWTRQILDKTNVSKQLNSADVDNIVLSQVLKTFEEE
jgi:hypothetical protein